MTTLLRWLVSPFLCILLLFVVTDGALAAPPRLVLHQQTAALIPLTISITTTNGTVWGTVTARYNFRHHTTRLSCMTAICKFRVPHGVMLRLGQVTSDATTWPFKDWQVNADHHLKTMNAKSPTIKVTGSVSVTAVYVVAGAQLSSYGSAGSNWP